MSDDLVIKQSRLGIRTFFTFRADKLTYVISDRSGEREFSVSYPSIDLDNNEALSIPSGRPTMYCWAAGFPTGFAALRVGYDHPIFGGVLGAIGFALIFIGMLARDRKWFRIRMDLVPAIGSAQPLRVLRDSQHGRIMQELADRRRTALREAHATLDPNADPERERARFDWLLESGIISAEEHAAAVAVLLPVDVPRKRAVH